MPSSDVLQVGIGALSVPMPGATVVPVPWNSIEQARHISASPGMPEIEFSADGTFVAQWAISIGVASGGRKNSQVSLMLDDGGGFIPIPEVFGYGYHRNTSSGLNTISGEFRGEVSAGDRIQITGQRISGVGNLELVASSCSMIVGLIPS